MRALPSDRIVPIVLIVVLTLISGFADSRGFLHAANIWQDGRLVWDELAKSALGFAIGISVYWLVLRFMKESGIVSPEIQTTLWFTATLVGVAVASGSFFRWQLLDQGVAIAVVIGVGWLLVRTGG